MLDAVAKLARRRALVVVISDFIGDGDWGQSLLRLVLRHEVVALRVVDAADDELPDVGLVVVEDAETGEQPFASTLRIRCCAPGSALVSRNATRALPPECAGRGYPSTASAPTPTWPRRSSRSSRTPSAGAREPSLLSWPSACSWPRAWPGPR